MAKQINDLNKSLEEQLHLNEKQDKTDNNLKTNDKTVVGAINELFQSANNGKQLIANAIGSPLSSNDTFSAMSDKINDIKSDLKQVLTDEGVSVSEKDDVASLITKVNSEFDRQVVPQGNASANQVLQGSTFMNSSGQLQTGTIPYLQSNIPNVNQYTANHYMTSEITVADLSGLGGNCVYFAMPTGVYNTIPWLMSYTPDLRPENIISGINILGVWGNATVSSLGGVKMATGSIGDWEMEYNDTSGGGPGRSAKTITISAGFKPTKVIVHIQKIGNIVCNIACDSTYSTSKETGTLLDETYDGSSRYFWISSITSTSFNINASRGGSYVLYLRGLTYTIIG